MTADVETVTRIGDLDALKIEVFHGCIDIGLDIFDAADSTDVSELFPTFGSYVTFDVIFRHLKRSIGVYVLVKRIFRQSGNVVKGIADY